MRDARIVDEHVDAAMPLVRPRDDGLDVGLARDVAAHEFGARYRCRRGGAGGLVAIGEHERRAFGGEALRAGEADAAGGARHDGHAVLQSGIGGHHAILIQVEGDYRSPRATGRSRSEHHSLHDPG